MNPHLLGVRWKRAHSRSSSLLATFSSTPVCRLSRRPSPAASRSIRLQRERIPRAPGTVLAGASSAAVVAPGSLAGGSGGVVLRERGAKVDMYKGAGGIRPVWGVDALDVGDEQGHRHDGEGDAEAYDDQRLVRHAGEV